MHCWISATTFVTRTRYNVTLYNHCQSCCRYRPFRLASSGKWHGEESRERCLGHYWLETVQNGFFGRSVVSLTVDEAHYTRYPKTKPPISPPCVQKTVAAESRVVWTVYLETVQGISENCVQKVSLPKLPPNAGMSSVCCIDFAHKDSVVLL
jgi:hypothetical protein